MTVSLMAIDKCGVQRYT